MPSKRKIAYEESSEPEDDMDDPGSKRPRVDADGVEVSPEEAQVRRSSRNGRGTGGRINQMQTLERIQVDVPGKPKSRHLAALDASTKDLEVNPMAPSLSAESQQNARPRPRPRLRTKQTDSQPEEAPATRPTFALAAPGQQFGFRIPDSNTGCFGSQQHSSTLSNPSLPASSIFSSTGVSTTPTSRTPSVCSSGHGIQEGLPRRRSSYLHKLALASQSRVEAPSTPHPRMREATPNVSSGQIRRSVASKPLPPMKGLTSPAALFDEPTVDSEPDSPPPRLVGMRRIASFAQTPREVTEEHTANFVIDEMPPSEDERIAEAAIRGGHLDDTIQRGVSQSPTVQPSALAEIVQPRPSHSVEGNVTRLHQDVEDVVAAPHRRRNRAPRLPNNSQLAAVRHQQRSASTTRNTRASAEQEVSSQREATQPPEAGYQPNLHVEPNHPRPSATEGADPSQLQFYEPAVRDIIERAKQFSHCDAASVNAFPHRVEFNKFALEYIEEAIQERRARSLLVPDGWWPQYANDICKLLWEDLGNWRSSLRKKARTYATQRYQWDAQNREVNKDIARQLLGDNGLFLRDGLDADGRTNNFAHPALAGLVVEFFYGGDKSVGKQFPEVFDTEVPRVAVAVAATALKVVLDEIASSQGEVNFRVATYSPVYTEMMGLMKKCDTSVVHGKKLKDLRCKWAETGSGGSRVQPVVEISSGLDVLLD